MNFYNFLKQQCYDCKNKYDLPLSCSVCPCKILINKVINPSKQTDCTNDIMYVMMIRFCRVKNVYLFRLESQKNI